MGIKKLSKKLLRLGRKANKDLGTSGKPWVEAVFETAIGVIEDQLHKRGAEPAKAPKARPRRRPRRPLVRRKAGPEPRKTVAKLATKPGASRERPARPGTVEQPPRAEAARAPAPAETLTRASEPDHTVDQSAT